MKIINCDNILSLIRYVRKIMRCTVSHRNKFREQNELIDGLGITILAIIVVWILLWLGSKL